VTNRSKDTDGIDRRPTNLVRGIARCLVYRT